MSFLSFRYACRSGFLLFAVLLLPITIQAQHSVARQWNEVLLEAIREDFARPTIHARNLYHVSSVMFDAWAVYEEEAKTYLLGNQLNGFAFAFDTIAQPNNVLAAQQEAISYAAYRLLLHRFEQSPGAGQSLKRFHELMIQLGYDTAVVTTDYSTGNPAALGNYLAQEMIAYGLQDGSNEINGYANRHYSPVNEPLIADEPGNPALAFPNRWQQLALETFVDQSGNVEVGDLRNFLGAEWGSVDPFALSPANRTVKTRNGNDYWVYHDPGAPPHYNGPDSADYQWNFALVAMWSSHLDPKDSVLWDISPASLGNISELPSDPGEFRDFYNTIDGGDHSSGHVINPITGNPYDENIVPRGDYTRVLAEFWADGPDSETPPGHWFTILNYVSDHPQLEKRYRGKGELLSNLEWDVISYFTLGGAVHDAAVTAWSIKGWYDYIRPVSAIRFMADQGQSSDPEELNYDPQGMPLTPGYVEVIKAGDALAGVSDENVGKIKVKAWRGPDQINDPQSDQAGVEWILAENWWPYQRPTFVTPPFAGYVSGHSVFSRAAAEVLTLLTGDAYFPGGMGEFHAEKDSFLVFEQGPSVDVTLQWATYRDASDQTSLSRIWGGIHPPIDDIPGRMIGEKIGVESFRYARYYIDNTVAGSFFDHLEMANMRIFPNPVDRKEAVTIEFTSRVHEGIIKMYNAQGQEVYSKKLNGLQHQLDLSKVDRGIYWIKVRTSDGLTHASKLIVN